MVNVTDESLLTLAQARSAFPGRERLGLATLHRWRLNGVRGVRLETILIGGLRYTSREAIERFIAAQNAADAPEVAPQIVVSLSPANFPCPDPPMSVPPVRYEPQSIEEVIRMRQGKGPTTKASHGTKSIEAHHRQQVPIKNGGVIDELEMATHRGPGRHARHSQPSQLTPAQRAKEIRDHWQRRGNEYILPGGEGI